MNKRIVESFIAVSGTGIAAWGSIAHNVAMVEAGLFLVCLGVGVVPAVLDGRRRARHANAEPTQQDTGKRAA